MDSCHDLQGMTTRVLITVDTELSASQQRRGVPAAANLASSILGRTDAGDFGVLWQMDLLEEHGLRGVYFVDPMPGLVHGEGIVADMVGPIVARGHDVQVHIHTEWLEWVKGSPVGGRQGHDIADFPADDQQVLIGLARDMLRRAGARPTAFRAGNFGASDETLAVLPALDLAWDSSFNADYLGRGCKVRLDADRNMPVRHRGVVELPVSGLLDAPGHFRPAQVCAVSAWEMGAALKHAADRDDPVFTAVTHSFEMLSRDRSRPNHAVMARFEALCRTIAINPSLATALFDDLDDSVVIDGDRKHLAANRLRTLARMGEQALATWRYERELLPV